MNKKIFKASRGVGEYLVSAIIIGIFAYMLLAASYSGENKKESLQKGLPYGMDTHGIDVPTNGVVVSIYGVGEKMATSKDGKQELYMVATDTKIVVIEVAANDKAFLQLLENRESLKDNPAKRFVKVVKMDTNIFELIKQVESSEGTISNMERGEYISAYLYDEEKNKLKFMAMAVWIVPAILLLVALYKFIRNKKAYEELILAYPELQEDEDLLRTNADFIDDKLKVVIYKNHLICYSTRFGSVNLQEARRLKLVRIVRSVYFIPVRTPHAYFQMVMANNQTKLLYFIFKPKFQENMNRLLQTIYDKNPTIQFE